MNKNYIFSFITLISITSVVNNEAYGMFIPLPTTEINYKKSVFSYPIGRCKDFAQPVRLKGGKNSEFYAPAKSESLLTEQQYMDMFRGLIRKSVSIDYNLETVRDALNKYIGDKRTVEQIANELSKTIQISGIIDVKNDYLIYHLFFEKKREFYYLLHYTPEQLLEKIKPENIQDDIQRAVFYMPYDSRLCYCFNWDGIHNRRIDIYGQWFDDLSSDQGSLLYRLRDQNAIHQYMIQHRFSPRQMADLLVHDLYVARNRCATHLAEEINKRLMALLTDRRSWIRVHTPRKQLQAMGWQDYRMARLLFEGRILTHGATPIDIPEKLNPRIRNIFVQGKTIVENDLQSLEKSPKSRPLGEKKFIEYYFDKKITEGYKKIDCGLSQYEATNTCWMNAVMPFYKQNNIIFSINSFLDLDILKKNNDLTGAGSEKMDPTSNGKPLLTMMGCNVISYDNTDSTLRIYGTPKVFRKSTDAIYGPWISCCLRNAHYQHLRLSDFDEKRKKFDSSWAGVLVQDDIIKKFDEDSQHTYMNKKSIQEAHKFYKTQPIKQKKPKPKQLAFPKVPPEPINYQRTNL